MAITPASEQQPSVAHGRAPWFSPTEMSEEQRSLHDQIAGGPRAAGGHFALVDPEGRLEGPFNGMLLAPRVGEPLQALGAAIRYGTSLSDREREAAILVLAAARRSAFEWYAHERVGRAVGLDDAEVEALQNGSQPASFSVREQLVVRVVGLLVRDGDLDDATFGEVVATLGASQTWELVSLVGYYDLLALQLRVWRTPLPEGVVDPFGASGGGSRT